MFKRKSPTPAIPPTVPPVVWDTLLMLTQQIGALTAVAARAPGELVVEDLHRLQRLTGLVLQATAAATLQNAQAAPPAASGTLTQPAGRIAHVAALWKQLEALPPPPLPPGV